MKVYNEFLNDKNPVVELILKTKEVITIELFLECAPKTVENFLKLVDNDFYKDIIFHRVIENFMIQAGDPTGSGMSGSNDKILGEFRSNGVKNDLMHTKGVISMARTNDPNSASSQFFIMHKDSPHLDGMYAAFGAVTKGLEVVDMIAKTPVNQSRPVTAVVIETIRRVR